MPLSRSSSRNGVPMPRLNEDSEQRMSCSDLRQAGAAPVVGALCSDGLSSQDVMRALKHVEELFPEAGGHLGAESEDQASAATTIARSRDGSACKDPLSRHNALGRRRVDSSARPEEFVCDASHQAQGIFAEEDFQDRSFSMHHINTTALRQRLDSNVLDWSTVGRVQNDFVTHDKLSPNDKETLHEMVDRAHNLHRTNSLSDARSLYEKVLNADPLDWDCLSNLAKISFAAGDFQKAKQLFERAVAVRPERDKTVFYLGHVLVKLQMHERAAATFNQVLHIT